MPIVTAPPIPEKPVHAFTVEDIGALLGPSPASDGSGLVAGTAPCRTRQPVRVVRSRSDSIRRSGSARGGGQADNSGNVSDGGPVDAAVAVDAQTRPQRLGQAADGLPTATTGTRLIVVFNRGWGNFR